PRDSRRTAPDALPARRRQARRRRRRHRRRDANRFSDHPRRARERRGVARRPGGSADSRSGDQPLEEEKTAESAEFAEKKRSSWIKGLLTSPPGQRSGGAVEF